MENASKALIMAAGVLIGILILSLAVYLFATFGAGSAQVHSEIEQDRINQFNAQFTSYEGKEEITIYDIITVANLAKDNNEYYSLSSATNSNYYITVSATLQGGTESGLEKKDTAYLQGLIEEETREDKLVDYIDENGVSYKGLYRYKCNVTINQTTRKSKQSKFYQINKVKKEAEYEKNCNIFLYSYSYNSWNFIYVYKL